MNKSGVVCTFQFAAPHRIPAVYHRGERELSRATRHEGATCTGWRRNDYVWLLDSIALVVVPTCRELCYDAFKASAAAVDLEAVGDLSDAVVVLLWCRSTWR